MSQTPIEDEAREAYNAGLNVRSSERRTGPRTWDTELCQSVRLMLREYDYLLRRYQQENHVNTHDHWTNMSIARWKQTRICLAALSHLFNVTTSDGDWVETLRQVVG